MDKMFLIRVMALALIFAFASLESPQGLLAFDSCEQFDCSVYDIDGEDDCVPEEDCEEDLCDPNPHPCCVLEEGGCYEDTFCDVGESPWKCIYERVV